MRDGSPQLVVLPDPAGVASLAAELVLAAIDRALEERGGRADIALAGGTTPAALYDLLTQQRFDWTGVHLWIGDERCVPHDHPDSNVKLVNDHLPAPGAVLHAPPGAGKTTVVPLRLLAEPWLAGGKIVILEPRRLAARAAARGVGAPPGGGVRENGG